MIFGSLKDAVADLSKRVMLYYEELVKTTARFDDLRLYTKESLDEYKRVIEMQQTKMAELERERVKAEAELWHPSFTIESSLHFLMQKNEP